MALEKIGLIIGLLIAITAISVGIVSADPVPNPDNGHYYEVVNAAAIQWSTARTAASERTLGGDMCSGYLATVTSQEENDFIVASFAVGSLGNKWLGGFQDVPIEINTGWQWVTGEDWSYTNWNAGEPNNRWYSQYGNEDALTYWSTTGKWNDAPSTYIEYGDGGYVVEYDCMQVLIDIKPGSYPNSINNNGKGVILVAILTTDSFDAATVNPSTITLDGATPRMKGNSGNIGSLEDVDGDGDLDLVVQIQDVAGKYSGDTMGILSAVTYNGVNIRGEDTIRIVPPS